MLDLEVIITDKAFVGQIFTVGEKAYKVEKADNFEYNDPVDGSLTRNQVIRQIISAYHSSVKHNIKSY